MFHFLSGEVFLGRSSIGPILPPRNHFTTFDSCKAAQSARTQVGEKQEPATFSIAGPCSWGGLTAEQSHGGL